ncbi:hypothetical protein [Arenicella xantha]|nr:hypothetical protein [Arenicella xantha]
MIKRLRLSVDLISISALALLIWSERYKPGYTVAKHLIASGFSFTN